MLSKYTERFMRGNRGNNRIKFKLRRFQIVREKIYQPKDAMTKSCDVDLVTEWDQKVEKLLVDNISSKFPDHKYVPKFISFSYLVSVLNKPIEFHCYM